MQSEKDKIMELLTVTEIKEGGEVIFTDRSIEILQELGQQYKETPLFKKSRQDNPDWEGDANAGLLFVYMCERLMETQSRIHTMIVCKLMIPLIWEKLEQELQETAAVANKKIDPKTNKPRLKSGVPISRAVEVLYMFENTDVLPYQIEEMKVTISNLQTRVKKLEDWQE